MAGIGSGLAGRPMQGGALPGDQASALGGDKIPSDPVTMAQDGFDADTQGEQASPEEQALYENFVNDAMDMIYPEGEGAKVSPQILDTLRGNLPQEVTAMFADAQPAIDSNPLDAVAATAVIIIMLLDAKHSNEAGAAPQAAPQDAEPPMAASPVDDPQNQMGQMPGDEQAQPAPMPQTPAPREPAPQNGANHYPDDVIFHGGVAILEELVEVAEAAKIHEYSEKDIERITYRAVDLFRTTSPRVDPDQLKAEFGELMAANDAGTIGQMLPGIDHAKPGDGATSQPADMSSDDPEAAMTAAARGAR